MLHSTTYFCLFRTVTYWLFDRRRTFSKKTSRIYLIVLKGYSVKLIRNVELMHTYIIGYYNPLVRITIYLRTSLMLRALILYMSGGSYSSTPTLSNGFCEKLFSWQVYLLLEILLIEVAVI